MLVFAHWILFYVHISLKSQSLSDWASLASIYYRPIDYSLPGDMHKIIISYVALLCVSRESYVNFLSRHCLGLIGFIYDH